MAKVSSWLKTKDHSTEAKTAVTRVRLSPAEIKLLDQAMEQNGFSNRSQYIRYLIFRGSERAAAPPAGWRAIQDLAEALGPIGRNLNQATRALNRGGTVPPDLAALAATVQEIRRHLTEYGEAMRNG